MAADGIFLLDGNDLVLLAQMTPHDSEALLQTALAKYPQVIAGSTTEGGGGRLMLITREMGVPSVQDGSSTFSLDHLFIDEEGVPVLVEVRLIEIGEGVKRSTAICSPATSSSREWTSPGCATILRTGTSIPHTLSFKPSAPMTCHSSWPPAKCASNSSRIGLRLDCNTVIVTLDTMHHRPGRHVSRPRSQRARIDVRQIRWCSRLARIEI